MIDLNEETVFLSDIRYPWHLLAFRQYFSGVDTAVCGEAKTDSNTRKLAKTVSNICPKCVTIRLKD